MYNFIIYLCLWINEHVADLAMVIGVGESHTPRREKDDQRGTSVV